jgi:hypothetical protein
MRASPLAEAAERQGSSKPARIKEKEVVEEVVVWCGVLREVSRPGRYLRSRVEQAEGDSEVAMMAMTVPAA